MNLARQHFQKRAAQAAAEQATDYGSMQNLNAYELQLVQLNNDRARLKQIQSTEGKVKLKQVLLPAYMPYVEGILEANTGVQDDILMTVMVWCIDIGDYATALKLANHALKHNLTMPERFARTTATLITENICNEFLKLLKADTPVELDILHDLAKLVLHSDLPIAVVDMPDQVKAKLYLALGKATIQQLIDDAPSPHIALEAQSYLSRALALDDKCGGKTDLSNMNKLLTRLGQPTTNDDAPPAS